MRTGFIYCILIVSFCIINVSNGKEQDKEMDDMFLQSKVKGYISKGYMDDRVECRKAFFKYLQQIRSLDFDEIQNVRQNIIDQAKAKMDTRMDTVMTKWSHFLDDEVVHYNFFWTVLIFYVAGVCIGSAIFRFYFWLEQK